MNVLALLQLIQQIETGESTTVIKEIITNNNEIKQFGILILILFGLIFIPITIILLQNLYNKEIFTILFIFIILVSLIAVIDYNYKKTYKLPTTEENKEKIIIEKEITKKIEAIEIEDYKKQVLNDIKNHRKTKNAKIPIKTINIAKNYLYYIRHNSKENEM